MCSSIKKYLAWAPALTIAIMIFYFSSQPADVSTASSSQISRLLLQFADLLQLASLENANITALCELMETPVRKSAHILEFSILNISILYALHVWAMKGRKWIAAAWIITVLYACTDEIHQLFVPGRAGMVTDVMIDSIGVTLISIVLLWRVCSGEKKGSISPFHIKNP